MTKYAIQEHGFTFATIEAESAEEALEIAEKEYPRDPKDYNGYAGPVIWRAFEPGENHAAATLTVHVG